MWSGPDHRAKTCDEPGKNLVLGSLHQLGAAELPAAGRGPGDLHAGGSHRDGGQGRPGFEVRRNFDEVLTLRLSVQPELPRADRVAEGEQAAAGAPKGEEPGQAPGVSTVDGFEPAADEQFPVRLERERADLAGAPRTQPWWPL